jgi:hypothetical protein
VEGGAVLRSEGEAAQVDAPQVGVQDGAVKAGRVVWRVEL